MNIPTKAKEFMTTWHTSARSYLPAWALRQKSSLMNSGKSTRALPMFRAFDLLKNPNDRAIAQAVLDMGHRLGLQVVAEGVETRAQFDWLQDLGCTSVQGYLISRPVAPDLILDMAADSGPGDTAQLLFGT
jgi:hypothetical protein